jgi:hypothetical protein
MYRGIKKEKTMKRHIIFMCVYVLLQTHLLSPSILVLGDSITAPYVFTAAITTKVLNPVTGAFFVGVDAPSNNTYAISSATRPNFESGSTFQGIASQLPSPASIEFLSLTQIPGSKAILPFIMKNTNSFQAQNVCAMFENGLSMQQTGVLNNTTGNPTSGIVQLASSSSYIFAAVNPDTPAPVFGETGSGIALINVQCIPSTGTDTVVLTIKDATNGSNGNLAQALDTMSPELGTTPVTINPTEAGNPNANQIALHYDLPFDRLYAGLRITTNASVGAIGKAVTIGQVTNTGLAFNPIVDDAAITPGLSNEIIVAANASTDLRALQVRTMHASPGTSYLIVNGGKGTTNLTSSSLYALPLVDNPTDTINHGTLANKNSDLVNFKFVTPAAAAGDLPIDLDPAALVGGSSLPIAADTPISDIVVVGDTVYASINQTPSSINDTGIFYSQALYDGQTTPTTNAGKIVRWTPWVKRATPLNAFPGIALPGNTIPDGSVQFFDVDAKTGNMWIVEGSTQTAVGYTSWTATGQPNDLISTINSALSNGSYSTLDLNQAVRGITSTANQDRYALFGGTNKVLFSRISQAYTSSIASPQQVFTDFSQAQNSLVKTLPVNAGSVTSLEYSRQTFLEGNTNYFFAGTDNGLYVFSNGGNGFNVNTLSTLDLPPFSTGNWSQVTQIPGSIVSITTSGKSLYVLTFASTAQAPLQNNLYSIPFAPTVSAMFAPSNISLIASTNSNPGLQGTLLFTGMQIIATGDVSSNVTAPTSEQLLLTTNNGLFKSNADQSAGGGVAIAANQTDANWQVVDTTQSDYFSGINGIDTPIRHTTFPLRFNTVGDTSGDYASVLQLNGSGDGTIGDTGQAAFASPFFNAKVDTPPFTNLSPITYFFSDGTRRFLIANNAQTAIRRTTLSVIPFDTNTWSLSAPTILAHPVLQTVNRFFWVLPIGVTGLVMAGTEFGIVALG